MRASILDLRYHMNEVLKALDRNEEVEVLYHGKTKGIIKPVFTKNTVSSKDHPYFGMSKSKQPVSKIMQQLRSGRYNDI